MNDLDLYDSRYGVKTARVAVYEARRMGFPLLRHD